MKKMLLAVTIMALGALLFTSCSQNNPIAPSFAPEQGKMVFALDAASENIASGQVTIAKGALTHVLPITIVEHAGSVTFNTVQVGHWNIQVQLFDADGTEIYSGDGTAIVTKDQTTTVTVRVQPNTGTLLINVDITPGLVFWNKLGSMAELTTSGRGPGFDSIEGVEEFGPVKFNNGVEMNPDGVQNGLYCLNPVNIGNLKAGTIEFWYLSNTVIPDRLSSIMCFIYVPGKFNASIGLHSDAGYGGASGLYLHVGNEVNSGYCLQSGPGSITFSTTEPTHIACVWDINGIDGTADTQRIYVNGSLFRSSQYSFSAWTWDDSVTAYQLHVLGVHDYAHSDFNRTPNGKMDNLKIWNYPKTDFSDRLNE